MKKEEIKTYGHYHCLECGTELELVKVLNDPQKDGVPFFFLYLCGLCGLVLSRNTNFTNRLVTHKIS